jgi:hypothetical protein
MANPRQIPQPSGNSYFSLLYLHQNNFISSIFGNPLKIALFLTAILPPVIWFATLESNLQIGFQIRHQNQFSIWFGSICSKYFIIDNLA